MICGIDLSTRFIDLVFIGEDIPTWLRFPLAGHDAFDRARDVRMALPPRTSVMWDDVEAIGIEDPRGYNAGVLYRVQGAVLACMPSEVLIHPWIPSEWRKAVGMPGNASKGHVSLWVRAEQRDLVKYWPQDACDAYCIALATEKALIREQ